MSSRVYGEADEILKYLEGLREEKNTREELLAALKSERETNIEQMERVKMRLESLEENIQKENERIDRVNSAIVKAEATYEKLKESSRSLLDYLRKEYQDLLTDNQRLSRSSRGTH